MPLETPTFIGDFVVTNPASGDARSEGDDHLRNIKAAIQQTFPGLVGRVWRSQSKSSTYMPVPNDNLTMFNCTATLTLNLTAAATLGNGWMVLVRANGADITIDPAGAELVNGAATVVVPSGNLAVLQCDGAAFSCYILSLLPSSLLTGLTGNTTLVAADAGSTKNVTDGPAILTLPAASALIVGHAPIRIKSSTEKSVTIVPAGADTLDGDTSSTPYRLPSFCSVEIMKSAAGAFIVLLRPTVDVGDVVPSFNGTLKKGFIWANGVVANRTNQGGLFAVYGTTHGVGDGSTTFGTPDVKGRSIFGKDDMGGAAAANRITNGVSGFVGATLGAAGGSENPQQHLHPAGTLAADSAGGHDHSTIIQYPSGGGSSGTDLEVTGLAVTDIGRINAVPTQSGARTSSNGAHPHTISGSSANTGTGTSGNTPPGIIGNYMIKT